MQKMSFYYKKNYFPGKSYEGRDFKKSGGGGIPLPPSPWVNIVTYPPPPLLLYHNTLSHGSLSPLQMILPAYVYKSKYDNL